MNTDQIAAQAWRKWCGKPRDNDVEAEFKAIIKAAIAEATAELNENIRLLHDKHQALVSENVVLSRTAQASVPPGVPHSAREAVAKGIAAHRAAQGSEED